MAEWSADGENISDVSSYTVEKIRDEMRGIAKNWGQLQEEFPTSIRSWAYFYNRLDKELIKRGESL